jgi:hypothetical protein
MHIGRSRYYKGGGRPEGGENKRETADETIILSRDNTLVEASAEDDRIRN